MRLFSLLYIATSHTICVHYFSCVLVVVIYIYIFFFNTLFLIFFSVLKMSENVAKHSEIGSENSDILA